MQFNPLDFELVAGSVSPGQGWPGGVFEAVEDPPGSLALGGSPSGTSFQGTALQLAVFQLRARRVSSNGTSFVSVSVLTLSEPPSATNLGGAPIGGATPRMAVAGSVQVAVTAGGRIRRDEVHSWMTTDAPLVDEDFDDGVKDAHPDHDNHRNHHDHHHHDFYQRARRQSAQQCGTSLPCAACVGVREMGDTNGDCVFDLRDVSFAQAYVCPLTFHATL